MKGYGVKEAVEVKVNYSIHGTNGSDSGTGYFKLVKVRARWYVREDSLFY